MSLSFLQLLNSLTQRHQEEHNFDSRLNLVSRILPSSWRDKKRAQISKGNLQGPPRKEREREIMHCLSHHLAYGMCSKYDGCCICWAYKMNATRGTLRKRGGNQDSSRRKITDLRMSKNLIPEVDDRIAEMGTMSAKTQRHKDKVTQRGQCFEGIEVWQKKWEEEGTEKKGKM